MRAVGTTREGTPGSVVVRPGMPEDADGCGRIVYEAFTDVATRYGPTPYFSSAELAAGLVDIRESVEGEPQALWWRIGGDPDSFGEVDGVDRQLGDPAWEVAREGALPRGRVHRMIVGEALHECRDPLCDLVSSLGWDLGPMLCRRRAHAQYEVAYRHLVPLVENERSCGRQRVGRCDPLDHEARGLNADHESEP